MSAFTRPTVVRGCCLAASVAALAVIARADDAATTGATTGATAGAATAVRVHFAADKTELATLAEDVRFYSNREYTLRDVPAEMIGLSFTRRPGGKPEPATVDVPAGATVYLLVASDAGADGARDEAKGAAEVNRALTAAGWTRLGDARYAVPNKPDGVVATYRRQFDAAKILTLRARDTFVGMTIATRQIALVDEIKPRRPAGATTAPDTTSNLAAPSVVAPDAPISGPTTNVASPQASIQAMAAIHADSGLLLGQTTEVTLTVTRGTTSHATSLTFATPVDAEMTLARDDALRFVRLKYPNWLADRVELTFEDKYDAHAGGSIGAALGTLILSTIEGFAIDPNVAMTGDVGASGKVQRIGAVAAKLRGAIANKCSLVSLPADNYDQLVDGVVYNGPSLAGGVQVIGAATLAEAIATVRVDRDEKLAEAIHRFSILQQKATTRPTFFKSREAQEALATIVDLEPRHLSARVLLAYAQGKLPRTLSAAASLYYTSLAVEPMMGTLADRAKSSQPQVPSGAVRAGVQDLQKLRPLVDPSLRPLVDAWIRFVQSLDAAESHTGTVASLQRAREQLLDEQAKARADADMMQRMLREGI